MPETQQQSKAVEELLNRKEKEWKTNYIENEANNQGGEVEDLTFVEDTLEPASNEQAEEKIENISQSREIEIEKSEEGANLGATIKDSELNQSGNNFPPAIDTDFSPHQSEVATEVVSNPVDLVYRTEKWRTVRDANLPENLMAVEIGNSPGMVDFDYNGAFNVEDFLREDLDFGKEDRRPKPRYLGFVDADGQFFFAMGSPGSTQLNSGTPVENSEEVDNYFKDLFSSQDSLSILDITQGVSTLFDADPVIKDGEKVVEGGRDFIYDIFVSGSDAVKRNNQETRWSEELGYEIPTNENYGRIKEVVDKVESVRDYQELVLDTPAKLGPATNPEYFEADFEVSEEKWFVVDHGKEEGKTLEEIIEYQDPLNVKILEDGEMKDAQLNYEQMSEEDKKNHFDLFFTYQNSMFRPDVAPKENGVVEVRNFSNSERAPLALVTQKAMLANFDGVRNAFERYKLSSENAEEQRHNWIVNGLHTELPDGTSTKKFYEEELVPELSEGVRNSFDNELPYSLEKTLQYENITDVRDLEEHLDGFSNIDEFVQYQLELDEQTQFSPNTLNSEEYSEEYQVFQDWFIEQYENQMTEYLDEPTVNKQIHETILEEGVESAYQKFARGK